MEFPNDPQQPPENDPVFIILYPAQGGPTTYRGIQIPAAYAERVEDLAFQHVPFNTPFRIVTPDYLASQEYTDFSTPDGYGLGPDRFAFERYRRAADSSIDPEEKEQFYKLALEIAEKILNSEK